MIKILSIITGGLMSDGITKTQLEFYKKFEQQKTSIYIAAVHDNSTAMINEFKGAGCEVIVFPDRKANVAVYLCQLYLNIKKENYDIVHVHGSSSILSFELLVAYLAGIKVRIAHSHNTSCEQVKAHKLLKPLFMHLYTHAFACGEDAGKWLFGDKAFTVVHNGQDFSRFYYSETLRTEQRKKLGLEDKIAIGHVGRLNEQKNHQYLFLVFAAFLQQHPNAVLYLMGTGELKESLKKRVNELNLQENVVFTDEIDDVHLRLQAMDMMALPSLYEGLPTVVLEWQAVGLPCLVSNVITKECAPTDLVKYMSLGQSPSAWAMQMELMLKCNANRNHESQKAIMVLKEEGFDIIEGANKLEQMYDELVKCVK